jgi:threonine dehydrogenase-like Zn-dependent dehydrogenase
LQYTVQDDLSGDRLPRREDFEKAVALLADGTIKADSLITDIVPTSDPAAAVARLASGGEVVKLMIDSR